MKFHPGQAETGLWVCCARSQNPSIGRGYIIPSPGRKLLVLPKPILTVSKEIGYKPLGVLSTGGPPTERYSERSLGVGDAVIESKQTRTSTVLSEFRGMAELVPSSSQLAPLPLSLRPRTTRLGVVIPLANEESTITELLTRVLWQLGSEDLVFCILDRVSRDRTRQIVEQLAGLDSRVICRWCPTNRCVVDAYFAGYRAAYDAGCDWILEMDGGLSHLPEEIPQFLERMDAGYDYVGGSRFLEQGAHQGSWFRRCLSYGGTQLASGLLRTRMSDMTSGFECFNRAAMARVLESGVQSRAHFFQTEIRTLMHAFRWCEVPIHYRNPSASVSSRSIGEALRILTHLAWSRWRAVKPVR